MSRLKDSFIIHLLKSTGLREDGRDRKTTK